MKHLLSHSLFALLLPLTIFVSARGEDLSAVDLLPTETVVYLSIADSGDLASGCSKRRRANCCATSRFVRCTNTCTVP